MEFPPVDHTGRRDFGLVGPDKKQSIGLLSLDSIPLFARSVGLKEDSMPIVANRPLTKEVGFSSITILTKEGFLYISFFRLAG